MSRIIIAKKTGKGCSNSHDKLACLLLRKMEQGQLINVTSPKSKTNPETLVVLDDDNLQHMRDEPGEIQPTSSRESELLSAIPQEFVMDDNGLEQLRVASGNIEVEVIDVINKSFCCTECNHKTTTPKKLSAHLRAQHPDRIVSCSYCDYTSNYKVMKSHLEVMHSRENPFPCDECEQRFSKYSLLKDHQAAHSENRKFVCPTCDQVFSTKARLKSHMPSHGVSKYICDTCGGAFNSSKELSHHTIVDHGKKSYDCELCEYSCFSPGVLARHLRTHTGEKPFPCDFCDYRATEKARLKSHLMAAHSNNKPYACTICDYRTTRKDHLNVHIISHSQVKPFACDYCPLRCTTRGKLKEHMRMHTGEKPYSCDFCEYRAARKDYLYSHLRQHSGVPVKPRSKKSQLETTETSPKTQPRGPRLPKFFTCEICDYRMSTRDEFEAHMLIHSSKNPEPSKMVSERTEDQVAGLYLDNLADNHFDDVLEMSDSERDALGVLANAASFDMPVHDIIVVGSDMCVEVPQVQVPQVEVPQVEPETPLPKKSVKVLPPKSNKSAVLVVSEEPGEVRVASDQIDLIFACDLCDFRSQRRSQLKDHVTIEHPLSDSTVFLEDVVDKLGQKVYLCDYCNYSTIHPSAISVHTRTHTGEKRYGCTQCEYKSATLRRMREHVMIHLGHKPFACDQCEYSTARKDHLRVHKLFHTGEKPHGCDYCPYRCRTKEKLTVHMRIHTGEKPYACKHCDYRATRKDYMTSHMRQHVPGASPRPKRPKKNAPQVQQKRGRDTSSSSDSSDSEDDNENENENEVWM